MYPSYDAFAAAVGDAFDVGPGEAPIALTLTEAENGSSAGGSPTTFSLLFRSDGGASLAQGTHRVRHPVLGDFDLFLVPVMLGDGRLAYQAVFG